MACTILRNDKNEITKVLSENGNESKLFKDIVSLGFDKETALKKWALVYTPTFKNWFGVKLSSYNGNILWVPPGCAHGFVVLTNSADFLYKTTEYWFPEYEKCILWNDETLNINWFIKGKPILAEKDKTGTSLEKAEFYK